MPKATITFTRNKYLPEARKLLWDELGGFFTEENFKKMEIVVTALYGKDLVGITAARESKDKSADLLVFYIIETDVLFKLI